MYTYVDMCLSMLLYICMRLYDYKQDDDHGNQMRSYVFLTQPNTHTHTQTHKNPPVLCIIKTTKRAVQLK